MSLLLALWASLLLISADPLRIKSEEIISEMKKTEKAFKKLIGKRPRFMRPPYGSLPKDGLELMRKLGYFVIRWSIDTQDWRGDVNKTVKAFNGLVKAAHNKNSGIVLMHDSQGEIESYLPTIINTAKRAGYSFAKVSEILGGVNPYFEEEEDSNKSI